VKNYHLFILIDSNMHDFRLGVCWIVLCAYYAVLDHTSRYNAETAVVNATDGLEARHVPLALKIADKDR